MMPLLLCALAMPGADHLRETQMMVCTAYDAGRCCTPGHGITASGTRADHPLVAGPRRMLGMWVRVPGYAGGRWVRVEDVGGTIKGNRLDVLMPSHKAAKRWGRKRLKVQVQKGGER